MNRNSIFAVLFSIFFIFFSLLPPRAAGQEVLFSGTVQPIALILLDNSNSMDEDFFGNGVGSWATGSKSVEGKNVLNNLVNAYASTMRLGLMTYRLPSVSAGYINNMAYFVSYDPRSYCPDPPEACVEYCRTRSSTAQEICQTACAAQNPAFRADYIDDGITGFNLGTGQSNKYCGLAYPKTNRLPNWTDPGNYIYYKQALPLYSPGPMSNEFNVAPGYTADDSSNEIYDRYRVKTGTSDGMPGEDSAGYSEFLGSYPVVFNPTDSDIALGYNEFGKRMAIIVGGKTWIANTSPGNGYLHVPIMESGSDLNALLSKLTTYENVEAGYMSCADPGNPNNCAYILNAGLTPTAGTLQSAISYFQGTSGTSSPIKSGAATCQPISVIYVTDGLPSVGENGAQGSADSLMPAVLEKLRTLRSLTVTIGGTPYTYDIRTYVVGVGLTSEAKAKLDAMAIAGGTAVNDRAFYADDPTELQDALGQIFSEIQSSLYYVALPSVSSVRLQDENFLYAASFEPLSSDPFWKGHLKKIRIQDDGSLGGETWDAGTVLENTAESNRNMKTYIGGALRDFNQSIDPSYFGKSKAWERDQIVGYIRGKAKLPIDDKGSTVDNPDYPRKLGDIFHSNPVTIATPSLFFNDPRDRNQAFDKFRKNHQRTSRDGTRIIIAGANDGQIHAFETGGGKEVWSFIPPNLLPKLKDLAHSSHSNLKPHQYFVDGPFSAAEVWLPTNPGSDGTAKSDSEWKTLMVFGLGMGVRSGGSKDYNWSKVTSCDQDFNDRDKDDEGEHVRYFCGYYALDVTNTTQYPRFQWVLNLDRSQASYLGEPWSKMMMGKVKINGKEKWVGFIGGGYTLVADPKKEKKAKKGKGFFVVDLSDGQVLWSYTKAQNDAMGMIPGSPAIVDRDNDGFIDTAYVGDLYGNLWKFTFCPFDPDEATKSQKCNTSNWSAMQLFNPEGHQAPIFVTPAVAKDSGNTWIFFGTGDRVNPNSQVFQNRFYALKDQNRTYKVSDNDPQNIISLSFTSTRSSSWYMNLTGKESVLSDATVYNGIVFFTSYTPPAGTNLCGAIGSGTLYGIAMMPVVSHGYRPGEKVFSVNFEELGVKGIPSAPIISQKPLGGTMPGSGSPDVFVAVSGGTGGITAVQANPGPFLQDPSNPLSGSAPSPYIIHWRDRRVQSY